MNVFDHLEKTLGRQRRSAPNPKCQASVMALLGFQKELGADAILLMKRTDQVETHKSQICFPGGFREDHDKDLLETALRETEEEIGVERSQIRVLGALTPVLTKGDILIQPYVGLLPFPYPFQINPREVERLFYLRTQELLERGLEKVSVEVGGFQVFSEGIVVEQELVWGATARMLSELREFLLQVFPNETASR